jgi:hypothetical protein
MVLSAAVRCLWDASFCSALERRALQQHPYDAMSYLNS